MGEPEASTGTTMHVKKQHILLVLVILLALVAFHLRHRILERFEEIRYNRRYTLLGFQEDLESGFSSSTFDLSSNMSDTRDGLDRDAKAHIQNIMDEQNITFDEARLVYLGNKMRDNGVGENGVPLDPKTVTFS